MSSEPRSTDGVRVRRALVIGVEHYVPPTRRLPTCALDAERVARALAARGYRVEALHDGPGAKARPTRAAVRAAVRRIARAATDDDLVVVYAACHGVTLVERPYLMLADTPADDVPGRGLPLAEIAAMLRGGARWSALFLDACQIGLGLDPTLVDTADDADVRGGGFALLAASSSVDRAQDTLDAGIFSKCLLTGLAGAAADEAGAVSSSALARHVQDGLARWREGAEGELKTSRQAPVLRLEIEDLALVPPTSYRLLAEPVTGGVEAVAFAPRGRLLATAGGDGAVRLWDPATGAPVRAAMNHAARAYAVRFSDDGRRLWSVDERGVIQRWDVARTAPLPGPAPLAAPITTATWSSVAEGRLLAPFNDSSIVGMADDALVDLSDPTLVDRIRVRNGVVVRDRRTTRRLERRGHVPLAAVYERAPGRFITAGSDGSLLRWRAATGRAERFARHEGPVWALALSPDGRQLAAGGADAEPSATLTNEARIWDLATGKATFLRGHRGAVTAIAYRPDGAWLATAALDGLARLWHAASGQLLRELTAGHLGPARAVAFSPDGRRLAVGHAGGAVAIFDVGVRG